MLTNLEAAARSCVVRAIEEVNVTRDPDQHVGTALDTDLLGAQSPLDSVTFAFLIVTIEQFAMDDYDADIVLFDEEAMGWDYESLDNPFYTVGSLAEFTARKMDPG